MTARPIRRNAQTPDRNGKIFYTSTTSLSHISKVTGHETAYGGRRRCTDWDAAYPPACEPVQLRQVSAYAEYPRPDRAVDKRVPD